MNQEKELVKNTTIYAIGNIGSKVLAYIMVLVYSHFISRSDLGFYDIMLTTVSMLQPIITLQISDGVYRKIVVDCKNKEIIISTAFRFIAWMLIISEAVLVVFLIFRPIPYKIEMIVYLFSTILFFYFHESIRGLKQNKKYAIIGLIYSGIMLSFELLGLLLLHLGVFALMWANNIALIICIIIMIIWQDEFRLVFRNKFDKNVLKELLAYSGPLVPNTVCWWIVNSSDRYIILFFLGTAYNGIYSISNKFPTVLTTITGIFYLAWQESAIKEYYSKNRNEFYSKVFKQYYRLLFSMSICAIPLTHIVVVLFAGIEYRTAWLYSGFLYLGAVFSALSSFLGLGYQISKETKRSIFSTVLAAVINFAINVIFIKYIGLYAASLSTFVAYFLLFSIRIVHCRKYYTIRTNWKEFFILLVGTLMIMLVTNSYEKIWLSLILSIIGMVIFVVLNYSILLPIMNKIRHILYGGKNR